MFPIRGIYFTAVSEIGKIHEVIHPRSSIILLAAGSNLAWLTVAELAAQEAPKENADSEVVRKDGASDKPAEPSEPPPELTSVKEEPSAVNPADSPVAEPISPDGESSKEDLPPTPEPPAVVPNSDEAVTPDSPSVDNASGLISPTAESSNPPDHTDEETPFTSELPAEAGAPPSEESIPWTFASGGNAGQPALGFEGGGGVPSGFMLGGSGIPLAGVSVAQGILEGFTIATSLSGIYTSNVTNSPGEPIAPIQDDFIVGLGGSISYLSKATEWTFGGSYTGNYNKYFELDEFNAYNQGFGLVANYNGKKLSASANANVSYDQGVNRFFGSQFIEQTTYNFNLNTRYRLSNKTSLQGTLGQNFLEIGEGSSNDRETFTLSLASLWRYSKLTEFGPGIRYSQISGGGQVGLNTLGPEILVNYQLGSKVRLNSRVGVQFAEYDNGAQADPFVSSSIGLNYTASKLWGMNLSVSSGAQAEGSTAEAFNQLNSVRLGYSRRIRKASLNLGLSYEVATQQTSNSSVNPAAEDRNFFNANASLGMPILSNTTFASIFIQFADQSADSLQSWNAVQSGFSLTRRF